MGYWYKTSHNSNVNQSLIWKGILLFAFATFNFLSLISYDVNDPCLNVISSSSVKNICGTIGAIYSDILIQFFGVSSYIFVFFFFYLASNIIFFNRKEKKISFKILYTFITMISISIILSIWCKNSDILSYNLCGCIGIYVSSLIKNIYIKIIISLILVFIVLFYPYCFLPSKEQKIFYKFKQYIRFLSKVLSKILRFIKYLLNKLLSIFLKLIVISNNKSKKTKIGKDEEYIDNIADVETKNIQTNIYSKKFFLPHKDLLSNSIDKISTQSDHVCSEQMFVLEKVFAEFGVRGEMISYKAGPIVTSYEFKPRAGTKSSRVTGLSCDIARMMKVSSVRISTIVGKDTLSIEVPNNQRSIVCFRKLIESDVYVKTEAKLPLILGCNIFGRPVIADLTLMPHLLIAGTTGSGKSVGINGMILSMLYKLPPEDCRFIMIDPKMLEFSLYDGIPNLLMPVITDAKEAVLSLKWVVKEMENRYKKMSEAGVRNIIGYNEKMEEFNKYNSKHSRQDSVSLDEETNNCIKLPYIVVIIDEMADLMVVAGKEIEVLVQRLSQMARAAGIHLIMATQRPSVDVITGVIKANFPTRIAYQVTSKIDSRTILGEQGAEQLLGKGDMLFLLGGSKMTRVHGPLITDAEVENVVNFLKNNNEPPRYVNFIKSDNDDENDNDGNFGFSDGIEDVENSKENNLYRQAVKIVIDEKKTSISYIQRKLRIGYNKAANFIEKMEEDGILSPADHTGKRHLLK